MGKGSVFRVGAPWFTITTARRWPSSLPTTARPVWPHRSRSLATPTSPTLTAIPATDSRHSSRIRRTFPLTPPTVVGGFNTFSGVSSDLKAPYQYVLNASYARPLAKNMSLEVGYVAARPSRHHRTGLRPAAVQLQGPKSGQTFAQAGNVLTQLYNSGLTPAQVKANPVCSQRALVQRSGAEPGQLLHSRSASANFFYDVYSVYAGSWLDTLNDIDRIRQGPMAVVSSAPDAIPSTCCRTPGSMFTPTTANPCITRWSLFYGAPLPEAGDTISTTPGAID